MDHDIVAAKTYLTDSGLAVEFGVSTRTIQRCASEPSFPKPVRIGRCRRWEKSEVEAYFRRDVPKLSDPEVSDTPNHASGHKSVTSHAPDIAGSEDAPSQGA